MKLASLAPLACSAVCFAAATLPGFSAIAHDVPVHLPPAAAHVGSHPVDPEPLPDDPPPKLEEPPLPPASSPLPPNVADGSSPAGFALGSSKGADDVAVPQAGRQRRDAEGPCGEEGQRFR